VGLRWRETARLQACSCEIRAARSACHAEGRGFESLQPLLKGLHLHVFFVDPGLVRREPTLDRSPPRPGGVMARTGRLRRIRAHGTSGPVAGPATEKHGLAAHQANGLPNLRSPKAPLVRNARTYAPARAPQSATLKPNRHGAISDSSFTLTLGTPV
jgi:hypothetical protein